MGGGRDGEEERERERKGEGVMEEKKKKERERERERERKRERERESVNYITLPSFWMCQTTYHLVNTLLLLYLNYVSYIFI